MGNRNVICCNINWRAFQINLVLWKGKPGGLNVYKTRRLLGGFLVLLKEIIVGYGGVISASPDIQA